mmetsp:Transcript_56130/g.177853  ORF Transcript_56130/g.177853 Transcript_56130/m.177853 type:complete len:166 (-) Transcript_56130:76-573(-)
MAEEQATESRTLMALGTAAFLEAMIYRMLPFSLIPNWMPLIGGLDEVVAGMVMGFGAVTTYIGWEYGTGPKPQQAIYVVETFSVVYASSKPVFKLISDFSVKLYNSMFPVLAVVYEKGLPLLRRALNSTIDAAMPIIGAARDQVLQMVAGKAAGVPASEPMPEAA